MQCNRSTAVLEFRKSLATHTHSQPAARHTRPVVFRSIRRKNELAMQPVEGLRAATCTSTDKFARTSFRRRRKILRL
jgi:hypothetical protein